MRMNLRAMATILADGSVCISVKDGYFDLSFEPVTVGDHEASDALVDRIQNGEGVTIHLPPNDREG